MKFDAVVIGTGMGGATTGYALAKAGMRVLFLEKGLSRLLNNKMIQGVFAETEFDQNSSKWQTLKLAGRAADLIHDKSGLLSNAFVPFIGEGGGGSSALYGAVLERFKREDFLMREKPLNKSPNYHPEWPVNYDEMEAYYQRAEKLYGVSNAVGEKTKLSNANQQVWSQLEKNGLHPYILSTASENKSKCIDNCQSFLCRKGCKNDSEKVCLKPSVEQFGATLWDDCEVLKIEEKNGQVEKVVCKHSGKIKEVTADFFVLAAGAMASPKLLFQSSNSGCLNGLANSSGLLGRYLMRHCIDLFAVELSNVSVNGESQKQIGFNDFYQLQKEKFGTVQSFGLMPPVEVVMEELSASVPFCELLLSKVLKMSQPLMTGAFEKQFSNKLIFASIMEDSPNYHNKIYLDKKAVTLCYKTTVEDNERSEKFRNMIVKAFDPLKVNVMKQANNNKRIAHACGTCRFGDDPAKSVLNRFNQTHDVSNLFITDASFFPTSGGTNPSLTIAANALRVADYITIK